MVASRLLRIAELSDRAIDSILTRAAEYADGATACTADSAIVALAFFQPSLRTRVGFASAAHRIGARPIEVVERRSPANSLPESVEDTLRVVSGYADALVVRSDQPADRSDAALPENVAWVNGGDGGADAEHPSQTLIDVFAMERLVGPLGDLHVVVTGDLRMRAARSLLRLLARRPPARLTVVSDPTLGTHEAAVREVGAVVVESLDEVEEIDALYAVGIPKGPGEAVRARLRVDTPRLARLSSRGAVLSPLPVIDEVAPGVRGDPRVRYFEQSDLALFVRMAVLEHLLGGGERPMS